jgi:hypothetical protein
VATLVSLTVVCHLKLKHRDRACPGDVRKLSLRRESVPDLTEYEFWDGVCSDGASWRSYKTAQLSFRFSNFTCRTPHHICSAHGTDMARRQLLQLINMQSLAKGSLLLAARFRPVLQPLIRFSKSWCNMKLLVQAHHKAFSSLYFFTACDYNRFLSLDKNTSWPLWTFPSQLFTQHPSKLGRIFWSW